jgi:hypothetical protein
MRSEAKKCDGVPILKIRALERSSLNREVQVQMNGFREAEKGDLESLGLSLQYNTELSMTIPSLLPHTSPSPYRDMGG